MPDCLSPWVDLDRFFKWVTNLGLSLNLSKYKVRSLRFYRRCSPILYPYNLSVFNIPRIDDCVKDFGLKLSYILNPDLHIDYVCAKAFKTLGLIIRLFNNFHSILSVKLLFCTLVRPTLENGAVIWNLQTVSHTQELERVQRKLLKFISFYHHIPCTPHDYTPIISLLGLSSIAKRKHAAGLLNGLLNDNIDSHALLSLLLFKVPQRSYRSSDDFYLPHASINY